MSRHRHFVFTLNNYKDKDETYLSTLECKYIVWGYEYAPTTGTPHLQGFISFRDGKTDSAVRKLLPGCFIEPARGTPAEASAYCKKEQPFFEAGELPVDKPKGHDWDVIRRDAENGNWSNIPADIVIRYPRNLQLLRSIAIGRSQLLDLPRLANWWVHGPTGTGKSRGIRRAASALGYSIYLKECNKWWDGYDGEPVVLLEEFEPLHVALLSGSLKLWGDHYPFRCEVKGGGLCIRPQHIIVTSNYDMETLFAMSGQLLPLQRRYQTVDIENGDEFSFQQSV